MVLKERIQGKAIGFNRIATGLVVLTLTCCFVIPGARAAGNDDDPVAGARTVLEKWVETRRLISKEKRDWKLGREMLNDRVELVKQEIESLRERIIDAKSSIDEADKKRTALVKENEQLKEGAAALSEKVVTLEGRLKKLLSRLPDPIRDRVRPLSQRLPDDAKETKLSLAERFQNVVGIVNEVNKFNREVTVTSEVRELHGGTTAEVTSLYVGIGQAYYVTVDGKSAGVGSVTAEGWTWRSANEAAEKITQAIAIVKNEQAAGFVQLPIRVE